MGVILPYKFKTIEYNKDENAMIKETQNSLKKFPNNELPSKMFKRVIESMMENRPVVTSLCEEVDVFLKAYNNKLIEASLLMNDKLLNFIDEVKKEEDFIKAYVITDNGIQRIWIAIIEASFKNNKKYLMKAREFKKENECEFELTIFDKNQIAGMEEELESYQDYRMIN